MSKRTIILVIIMFIPSYNKTWYKEHVIYLIVISFIEGVTIVYWLENMNIYVYDMVETYKD